MTTVKADNHLSGTFQELLPVGSTDHRRASLDNVKTSNDLSMSGLHIAVSGQDAPWRALDTE